MDLSNEAKNVVEVAVAMVNAEASVIMGEYQATMREAEEAYQKVRTQADAVRNAKMQEIQYRSIAMIFDRMMELEKQENA